jgi:alpha-L-fucosidase
MDRRAALRLLAVGPAAAGGRAQDADAVNREMARKPRLKATDHPDAQWFPKAGLGLFIHWGIASVHGQIDLSWGMMHGMGNGTKITPEEYFRLAERFRPDRWDPDSMLAAAKKAGFRYAVLTTKHHEGFALWPSEHGEFNTRKYAGGRDLVRPFVDACRKHGLKVGFYYSPGDWHYAREYMSFNYRSAHCWQNTGLACRSEVADFNTRFEPVTLAQRTPEFDRRFREYKRGQIRELLTRYGKVDVLWFDMADVVMTPEEIRSMQPGIIINNRMGEGTGDFLTPEGKFPTERPGGWWELCTIWNSPNWGYVAKNEERYLPAGQFLSTLVKTRAWDGNLLINVGPRADGSLPKPYWEGAEEIASWMKHSGESVFGTEAGMWPESADAPVTVKGRVWYAHALPGSTPEAVKVKAKARPARVSVLRTGQDLAFEHRDGWLRVETPQGARTELVDVLRISFE